MRQADQIVKLLRIGCGSPRVHGNGFIQLDLTQNIRLHVWGDMRIPKQKTNTPLHNHTFGFTSYVLGGALRDDLFEAEPSDIGPYQPHRAVTRKGEDTILVPEGGRVNIRQIASRMITAPRQYSMDVGWIHQSTPLEPTVSVIVKDGPSLAQGGTTPLVYVPVGVVPSNDFNRYEAASVDVLWDIVSDVIDMVL